MSIPVGGGGLIAPATSTTIFFCINVIKNVKEKFSSGFGVTKIKTDTTRGCFQNSWCNHPCPPTPTTTVIHLSQTNLD